MAPSLATSYCIGKSAGVHAAFLSKTRAPTFDEASIAIAFDRAFDGDEQSDVLFIGDSACRHGIDPIAFEKLTGLKSWGLGMPGNSGVDFVELSCRAYLENHRHPKLIVLCLAPESLEFENAFDSNPLATRIRDVFGNGTIGPARTAQLGAQTMFGHVMGMPDVLAIPVTGAGKESFRELSTEITSAHGYLPLAGKSPSGHDRWSQLPLRISEDWQASLERIAADCAAHNVPLCIRLCPIGKRLFGTRDLSGIEPELAAFESAHPRLRVCRPAIIWYDDDCCWDTIHLNATGVARFMPIVAKDVQEALAQHEK